MSEIEILRKLVSKINIANDLEIKIRIWSNEEKNKFIKVLDFVKSEIKTLKRQLTEIEDNSYSIEAHSSIMCQLEEYINEINKVSPHLNLSRNQGLIIENAFFDEILRDINYLITGKTSSITIPEFLKYTVIPEDSINIPKLTFFLRNEIMTLKKIEKINYLILWNYKNDFINRVIEQFIE